uniref:Transposon Ty3-I Gag-Pol polyprotein n=1 Tax=Cajanus cajan TaxID=3821 RepID=A0A151S558_CAJCA|nr:Transposon Ty3-I Gag-Pol polyprotein [Cajanus cajan]
MNTGFIREVRYTTWLANVVLVKKNSGKWRMCVDYTDLNKAFPKDSYPLPSIDRLVDGASGHALLSFLDAYSGYNQIMMYPPDEEHTAFITDHANFFYRMMPFSLKNTGATYQRLMDKVFQHQIGRNMEVYVDNMVVKTPSTEAHAADLAEAFNQIWKHNMRLNSEKCIFDVQGGKFLGFMITSRGIEANLEKCNAIIQMQIPQTIKDIQRLAERLVSLSRFIPKLVEKA